MAPIKFEEHIKEQLEKRTLQPSNEAWKNLSNRLEIEKKTQNKTTYWWIGLAASVLILISITLSVLNKDIEHTPPTIVDVKETISEKETLKKNNPHEVVEIKAPGDIVLENRTEEKIFDEKTSNKQLQKTNIKTVPDLNTRVVITETPKQQNLEKETVTKQETPTFEDTKVLDVVAKIQKMKDTPSGISDKEIDSLLKVAHKEILQQRLYNETTKTVDAETLLQDVEFELEQSFRTKVFEALKTNYNKVKTAVAERNN